MNKEEIAEIFNKAKDQFLTGEKWEAILLTRELIKHDEKNIEAWIILLGALISLVRENNKKSFYTEIRDISQKALILFEDQSGEHVAELWYNLGKAYLGLENFSKAIKSFKKGIGEKDDLGYLHFDMARAFAITGKDGLGLKSLEKAIQLNPVHKDDAARNPGFTSLRKNRKFINLVGRLHELESSILEKSDNDSKEDSVIDSTQPETVPETELNETRVLSREEVNLLLNKPGTGPGNPEVSEAPESTEQAEIEKEIFDDIKEEEVLEDKTDTETKSADFFEEEKFVKIYDFKRPDLMQAQVKKNLEILSLDFAGKTRDKLESGYNIQVDMDIIDTQQITFSEFIKSLPNPGVYAVLEVKPLPYPFVLDFTRGFASALLEEYFIGEAIVGNYFRNLTRLNLALLNNLLEPFRVSLEESWERIFNIKVKYLYFEEDPSLLRIIPSKSEMVAVTSFDSRINKEQNTLSLAMPLIALEPVLGSLENMAKFTGSRKASIGRKVLKDNLRIDSHLKLSSIYKTLKELEELNTGDEISLSDSVKSSLKFRSRLINKNFITRKSMESS